VADIDKLFSRLDALLERIDQILPAQTDTKASDDLKAYRWHDSGLAGIASFDPVDQEKLLHVDHQINLLTRNTAQFVGGKPANNALLWGARGNGKSSLIKAQINTYPDQQLCIVEVPKSATGQLFEIIRRLARDDRKFIIYLNDLSFDANDDAYKALKSCLDGSLQPQPDNVVIYATSNSIEENNSLADHFGLWLSFQAFTEDQYLAVVVQTLLEREIELTDEARAEALRFATSHGSRSGRIAFQFAAYWASLQD